MKHYLLAALLICSATLSAVEYTFEKIADTSEGSPFNEFKKSVAINDDGVVAFVGTTRVVGATPPHIAPSVALNKNWRRKVGIWFSSW